MGKKKDKKGKGVEKTQMKELKNAEKRLKKELSELGEDAIDSVISQHNEINKTIVKTSESPCDPPTPRCNMTLNAHPDKDILIMFGGEYCSGKETTLYNDLLFYHIKSSSWTRVIAPNPPVPRCSHQAVTFHQGGGQLWIFGGEYVNSKQTQFFHFNDLWVFHSSDKRWEKIESAGGPPPRSGHRMVSCRKMIFIFGGFFDNTISYRYFNDLHAFSVESRVWLKLQISGLPPSPRSGCVMAVTQDQCNIMVYGGYSKEKVKKDVDKGHIHGDMHILSIDGNKTKADQDGQPLAWKWSTVKQTGHVPPLRCSSSLVVTSSNRAVMFGGISDMNEDEEDVEGCCLNDMYLLEVDKGRWHPLVLRKPSENAAMKKRRRCQKRDHSDDSASDSNEEGSEDLSEIDRNVKKIKVAGGNAAVESAKVDKDVDVREEVFKVTVATKLSSQSSMECHVSTSDQLEESQFAPSARMKPMLAAKRGLMYLYGGVREEGSRQITLSDFYSIDLQKMNEWNVIIPQGDLPMDWEDSEDDSSSDEDDSDDDESDSEDSESEDSEEEEEDDPTRSGPRKKEGEDFEKYFDRTRETWKKKAVKVAEKEGIKASSKQIEKAALRMAQEYWEKITFSK